MFPSTRCCLSACELWFIFCNIIVHLLHVFTPWGIILPKNCCYCWPENRQDGELKGGGRGGAVLMWRWRGGERKQFHSTVPIYSLVIVYQCSNLSLDRFVRKETLQGHAVAGKQSTTGRCDDVRFPTTVQRALYSSDTTANRNYLWTNSTSCFFFFF